MRRSEQVRKQSGGFTLIELIVVIAIIAILAGLLLQVIVKVREMGPRTQARHDISQLGIAIENFKSTYDVKYIPSAWILSNNYTPPNGSTALQIQVWNDSRQYYAKVWPKAFVPPATSGLTPLGADAYNITLDGNQILVLLLGGIPPSDSKFPASFQGNRTGFLNSPTNPFGYQGGVCLPPVTGDRAKGPFFDFKLSRIDQEGHYHDPYWDGQTLGQSVYYYFSSKNGNDYGAAFGPYVSVINPQFLPGGFTAQGGYGGMDPFIGLDNKFLNPNGYQIISAGRNRRPGPGGVYDAGIGAYAPGADGGDDISNFAEGTMLGSSK